MFRIDKQLAKERYRRLSARYDYATRRIEPVRKQTIDALRLERGHRVLDVACGTGKSFELLREAVGPEGVVVGVEQSPEMLQQARERVREAGWDNVHLIESNIESADLKGPFDAVLFVYTQDVLQSDAALACIFEATRPGARVASTGLKLFPWYIGIANLWLLAVSYPYFTTFAGLAKPWAPLERYVDLRGKHSTFFGSGYIAEGVRR
ncbi:MAG: methyltransferase domain-containing protein [Gammaproteobacteria bacterium]|jgi:ubiquinone/menaquinone biosynthesis C-methylase UbiE|nr:methyltransferase domain-containing protein [Gammaproteobacteria bacterium]